MIDGADILVVRARIADLARTPLLAPREQRHAETLGRAAAAYVAGRTLVRRILARALRGPIEIVEPPDGKPHLAHHPIGTPPPGHIPHRDDEPNTPRTVDLQSRRAGDASRRSELDFNVSHAGELVLVAVARGRRVGVDVEEVSHRRDVIAIADGALGPDAALELRRIATEHRAARFTCWWVRIEALCKATGAGLTVPVAPPPPGFAVRDIAVHAGYRAAVAFDGGRAVIRTHDWSTP